MTIKTNLKSAVEILSTWGMNVSIYNHQLCSAVALEIRPKVDLGLDECGSCDVREQCGELFLGSAHRT